VRYLRLAVGNWEFVEEARQNLDDLPQPYSLAPNYPNPFNPATTISFTLPVRDHVRLEIFDVRGQLVRRLLDEPRDPGRHYEVWEGTDDRGVTVPAGIYVALLQAGDFKQSQKMALVR
jgi:hypothetical protein